MQTAPVVGDIGELFAKAGFGRDAGALLGQPCAKALDQGRRSCHADSKTLVMAHATDFGLDLIELGDAFQPFAGNL